MTQGHVFVAQPPLYRVKRKGREQYIYDDRHLHTWLQELGVEGTRLVIHWDAQSKTELRQDDLKKLLSVCERMESHQAVIARRGVKFGEYLALRRDGMLPIYAVRTEGKARYMYTEEELQAFLDEEKHRRGEVEILAGERPRAGAAREGKPEREAARPASRSPCRSSRSTRAARRPRRSCQLKELGFEAEDFLRRGEEGSSRSTSSRTTATSSKCAASARCCRPSARWAARASKSSATRASAR